MENKETNGYLSRGKIKIENNFSRILDKLSILFFSSSLVEVSYLTSLFICQKIF